MLTTIFAKSTIFGSLLNLYPETFVDFQKKEFKPKDSRKKTIAFHVGFKDL